MAFPVASCASAHHPAAAEQPPPDAGPVTVAGPRRYCTGLPLTTDRMNAADRTPAGSREKERGGTMAAPLGTSAEEASYFFFGFCLHATVVCDVWGAPPARNVVLDWKSHLLSLHFAEA